jgi:AraC-like DNA-binding protein
MAEELLRDKQLSIADVAIKLGYNDSNYFSTIYKKFTGHSPKYRRITFRNLEKNEKSKIEI